MALNVNKPHAAIAALAMILVSRREEQAPNEAEGLGFAAAAVEAD